MKAKDHQQLKGVIQHYESRRHMEAISMNMLAVFGLIGFGLMSVPLFTIHPAPSIAEEPAHVTPAKVFTAVPLRARSAVVYDISTDTILYGYRENQILPLASLTKLFTVYAALISTPSGTRVTVSESALAPEGDSGLSVGEVLSLGDLEKLALVASSNDAAEAVSEASASHEQLSSATLMANTLLALGTEDVRVQNATGLDLTPERSGGYGSALSVATVAKRLIHLDSDLAYSTTKSSVSVRSLDGTLHTLQNTNQIIDVVPNPLLSKTGFTDLAGGNLVIVFDAGINHPVAIVVLGSTKEERFTDVRALVNETLSYFSPETTPPVTQ